MAQEGTYVLYAIWEAQPILLPTGDKCTNGQLYALGWHLTPTGTFADYKPGSKITLTKDLTLYALWTESIIPNNTYNIGAWGLVSFVSPENKTYVANFDKNVGDIYWTDENGADIDTIWSPGRLECNFIKDRLYWLNTLSDYIMTIHFGEIFNIQYDVNGGNQNSSLQT